MPDREDILREETYKDQCDNVEHRIFYTLTEKKDRSAHRVAKAVTLVLVHLQKKQLLTDDELDELLLECVR